MQIGLYNWKKEYFGYSNICHPRHSNIYDLYLAKNQKKKKKHDLAFKSKILFIYTNAKVQVHVNKQKHTHSRR